MAEELSSVDRRQTLGVWLHRARVQAGRSLTESAAVLGCSSKAISGFESGQKSPTLPQIELLADFYRVPATYFWQGGTPPDEPPLVPPMANIAKQRVLLRQKLLGVQLRQGRLCSGKTLKEAAAELAVSRSRINQYECGEREIPLSELEALAELYQMPLEGFMLGDELCRPVAAPAPRAAATPAPGGPPPSFAPRVAEPAPVSPRPPASPEGPDLSHLDPELREFVAKPVNTLYLQVALRLSRLSVTDLRIVAESLLEITY